MSNGFIYVVDAHFIDKIEKKYPGPKCLWFCIVIFAEMQAHIFRLYYFKIWISFNKHRHKKSGIEFKFKRIIVVCK
jgi:hypothetical protein